MSGLFDSRPFRAHHGPVTSPEAPLAPIERVAVGYLAAQAVLGIAWWIALTTSTTVRGWFELMPGEPQVMDAFVFADVIVVVVGSGLGAWAVARQRRSATAILWFTAGGIVYPTLYLLGWLAFTGEGGLLLGAMTVVSVLTCWVTWQVWRVRRS